MKEHPKEQYICPACGNLFVARRDNVRSGNTKSCGCLKKPHGMWESSTYISWEQMKQRCLNEKAPNYPLYGGRGIKICQEWLDFKNFYKDMGDRPLGKSLDRINNNGDYEPSNCKWSTRSEQQKNKRPFSEWRTRGGLSAPTKEVNSCVA